MAEHTLCILSLWSLGSIVLSINLHWQNGWEVTGLSHTLPAADFNL